MPGGRDHAQAQRFRRRGFALFEEGGGWGGDAAHFYGFGQGDFAVGPEGEDGGHAGFR